MRTKTLAAVIAAILTMLGLCAVVVPAAQAAPYQGILLNTSEITALSSTPPTYLKQAADVPYTAYNGGWQQGISDIDLGNQDSTGDTITLAAALLYAKGLAGFSTTNAQLLTKVCGALSTVQTTGPNGLAASTNQPTPPKQGSRALSIARGLPAYIYAYDLVNAPTNCGISIATWSSFLNTVTTSPPGDGGGYTVASCEDHRVNNWGGFCQQSMVAYHAITDSTTGLAHDAAVFRAFAGEPTALGGSYTYAAGDWGSLAYQADSANPVGINRPGTTKLDQSSVSRNVDGVMPEDQRRITGCPASYTADVFTWPLCRQGYTWEDTQSEVMVAYHLQREGYDGLNLVSKAIKRVIAEHYRTGDYPSDATFGTTYPPVGDDAWIIPLANKLYGTSYTPGETVGQCGKGTCGADWWAPATSTTDATGTNAAPVMASGALSVLSKQPENVWVGWGQATDSDGTIAGYHVYVNGTLLSTEAATATGKVIEGQAPDTAITVTVKAVDNQGAESANSQTASFTTTPATVSELYDSNRQKQTFNLEWTAAAPNTPGLGTSGYRIYRDGTLFRTTWVNGGDAVFSGSAAVFGAVASYIPDQVCGTTHTWEVSAYSPAGEGRKGGPYVVDMAACTSGAMEGAKPFQEGTNASAIYFSIPPLHTPNGTLASSYRVYKDNVLVSNPPLVVTGSKITSALLGLTCHTTYSIAIAGVTAGGVEGPKVPASLESGNCGQADQTIPGMVGNFRTDLGDAGVALKGDQATDNVGVEVYIATSDRGMVAFVTGAQLTGYDTGALNEPPCGDPTSYRIQAVDAAGNRGNASVARFSTDCTTGNQALTQ